MNTQEPQQQNQQNTVQYKNYGTVEQPTTVPQEQLKPWLGERSFASHKEEFDSEGYLIFKNVLDNKQIQDIRDALQPHLQQNVTGRNNFEGFQSNRIYALIAKSPVMAQLAIHPLALAFAEADLGESCLLSAMLAINLHPGETVQPWHHDDGHCQVPLPRPSWGVSAFWAIDAMTEDNGATEFIPRSHKWGKEGPNGESFSNILNQSTDDDVPPKDAVKMIVPQGSLMLAKGTLWHRGGANKSDATRLLITPQYCPGWMRQLENMILTTDEQSAAKLPKRVQEIMGYSIHPPFMGYVDGRHPLKSMAQRG